MLKNFVKAATIAAPLIPEMAVAQDKGTDGNDGRPNIVVIVADDLLSSEISFLGGRNIHTPNIDRIAQEGISFNHCYASMAMSVPIRASMYTGLYPVRNGSYSNHRDTYYGTKTVNEYMPEEGYRVGRTGKDHPVTKDVYLFDEIPGFTVGCTNKTAAYSVDGIRKWVQEGQDPFLLYVCSINPHAPWTWGNPDEFDPDKLIMPENCVDSPEMRKIFCKYLAEIRALDNEVGSVYQMLEETGKLDNTIVMFLGEQGPQLPGGKWTLWYPGVHSALFARYPKRIKAGTTSNAIVQYEDLLPTFLDIAGGDPRPELDGISFKNCLYGESDKSRKYAFGIHNNIPEGTPYPIRSIRDDRYALILNLTPNEDYYEKHLMRTDGGPTDVWPAWLLSAETDKHSQELIDRFVTRPAVEFYDLKKDPWEMHNLAGEKKYQAKIAEMKAELLKWMEAQGDKGAEMDKPFHNRAEIIKNQLKGHDKAVLVKPGWIRDPYIVLGPDNFYYLTGTTTRKGDPRETADLFNSGLGRSSIVGNTVRVWKSRELTNWAYVGEIWNNDQIAAHAASASNKKFVWAPELHWDNGKWLMVKCPQEVSELLTSDGSDIKGPWHEAPFQDFLGKHDPSLFKDDDGTWYLIWGNTKMAEIKKDFSGLAADPVNIFPANRRIGHEGCTIKKIGGKYVLFGTAWSTDTGRHGTYNLYYCTADKVTGPYSERRFAGRYLGHGTPFMDKQGRWWCTAFYNANVPPVSRKEARTRDLSDNAYTINPVGTTLVPLEVTITKNDVFIRAIDPAYAEPGAEEVQKF